MLLRSVSTVATRAVHRVDGTQTDPNNKYKYTSNINQVAQGLQEKQNVANEGLTVLTCRASAHTFQTLSLALLSISWLAKIRMTFLHPGGQSLLASRDPEPFDPPEGPCLSQAALYWLRKALQPEGNLFLRTMAYYSITVSLFRQVFMLQKYMALGNKDNVKLSPHRTRSLDVS